MDTSYFMSVATGTGSAPRGLVLTLARVPAETMGIYIVGGVANRLPERALYLHPEAAASFIDELMSWCVVSDMFRSPESSLAAVRAGRGARPPGFSGHGYGLSIDLDVRASWRNFSARTGTGLNKRKLDEWMADRGWFCHRRDHRMEHEAWHYNWLGEGTEISPKVKTTAGYIEARIVELYGEAFKLDNFDVQAALQRLSLYHGEIDGKIGPLSTQAIRVFKRGWGLGATDYLDAKFCRTLAYVAAERAVVP